MKLLLDQNLSHRMLAKIAADFPASSQVTRHGLHEADDRTIWKYAKDHGFAIVTLDSDFHELATLHGAPPKVIWLKCGNRPRQYIESLLLNHQQRIKNFDQDDEATVLEIY